MLFTVLIFAACAIVCACAALAVALVVHRPELVLLGVVVTPAALFALALVPESFDWSLVVVLALLYISCVMFGSAGWLAAGRILEHRVIARRRRRHG